MKKKRKVKNIKADIWEICKQEIRKRDKNRCQKCGKHVEGAQAHTSHVIPKSDGNTLRFDFNNLKVLCLYCHRWWHGSPIEASKWFAGKFPDRYEYILEKRKDRTPVKRIDLETMLEEYKEKYL